MQQVNYPMNTSVNDNQIPHAMYQQNAQSPSYEQIQYQYLMVPNQSLKTSPNPMANTTELPQATSPPLAMPMPYVNQPMFYHIPSSPAMPQYYMPQFTPTASPTVFNFPSQPSLNSQLSAGTATSSMGSLPSLPSLENQTSTSSNVPVNLMTPVFLPNMMMDLQSMPQQGVHHPAQLGGLLVPQQSLTPMMNMNGMTAQPFTQYARYVTPSPMPSAASSTQYLAPSDGGFSQSISRGASTQPSPAHGPQEDSTSEYQTEIKELEISGNGMMQMNPFTPFAPNVRYQQQQQPQQLLGYYKCDPARVPVTHSSQEHTSRSRSNSAKNQLRTPPGFYDGSASRSPQQHGQADPTTNTQTPIQQNSVRNNGRQQRRGTKNVRMAPSTNDRAPKPTGRKKKQGKNKKKYGFRSKQNKIKSVMDNLTAKFTRLGSFVESDRVLRGENVVRVHVKKYQPLCEIEDALDACLVAPGVDIVEISLPLSMKNEFQRKGFLCYIKVQSKEQIPAIQRVLRQWQSFQKCDVALPSDKNKNLQRQTEITNAKTEVNCTSTVGEIPHLIPSIPEVSNNFTEREESKFNSAGPNPYELLAVSSTEDDIEEEEDDFDSKIFAFAPPNMVKSSSVVSIGDAA